MRISVTKVTTARRPRQVGSELGDKGVTCWFGLRPGKTLGHVTKRHLAAVGIMVWNVEKLQN